MSVCPSLSLLSEFLSSACLPLCFSVRQSLCLCLNAYLPCLCLSVPLSVCLSLTHSLTHSASASVSAFASASVSVSVSLSLSVCLSLPLFPHHFFLFSLSSHCFIPLSLPPLSLPPYPPPPSRSSLLTPLSLYPSQHPCLSLSLRACPPCIHIECQEVARTKPASFEDLANLLLCHSSNTQCLITAGN